MRAHVLNVCVSLRLFVLLVLAGTSSGLQCYSCENVPTNEECNVQTVTCSADTRTCYTVVEKRQDLFRIYEKGCMDSETCSLLEGADRGRYCDGYPSKCIHCCTDDKKICNAFNQVPPSLHARGAVTLWVSVLVTVAAALRTQVTGV